MARPEDDLPQDSHDVGSDSDSDAPEEVGQEVAKSAALKQIAEEEEAVDAATKAVKAKRRHEIERNTDQQKAKREKAALDLETIPFDLLAKVAAAKKGKTPIGDDDSDDNSQDEESIEPTIIPRNKRITFTKRQVTESTRFEAIDTTTELNLNVDKARKEKKSCFNFRDSTQFDRRRNKRTRTIRLAANDEKRREWRK